MCNGRGPDGFAANREIHVRESERRRKSCCAANPDTGKDCSTKRRHDCCAVGHMTASPNFLHQSGYDKLDEDGTPPYSTKYSLRQGRGLLLDAMLNF